MDRHLFKRFGESIQSLQPNFSEACECCFLTTNGIDIIGIGLFYEKEEHCTVAVVKGDKGVKISIGHFGEDYPIVEKDIVSVLEAYDQIFKR